MRNLLTFNDAASYLEIGVDSLYVQSVKKPDWYVKIGKIPYVDVEKYLKQRALTLKCYEDNTSFLYWMMKEMFVTDNAIAEWLSKESKVYTAKASWNTFIQYMFAIPLENGVELRRTMHSEFYKVSSITLYLAIRKGVEFESIYS